MLDDRISSRGIGGDVVVDCAAAREVRRAIARCSKCAPDRNAAPEHGGGRTDGSVYYHSNP